MYLPNPSARVGCETRSILKRSLTGLNSEFSFSSTGYLTKPKDLRLPYYLPITGGRIIGFITYPRVLVLCEKQSVSSRVCTHVTVSISNDDNDYTTGTSMYVRHGKRESKADRKRMLIVQLIGWQGGGLNGKKTKKVTSCMRKYTR